MKSSTFCKYSLILGGLLAGPVAFSQSTTAASDQTISQGEQLKDKNPETFVSQRGYEKPWLPVNEKDILWKKRLWRTIDTWAKGNKSLHTLAKGNSLATVLISGFLEGKYKAYSKDDERFITEISKEAFKAELATYPSKSHAVGLNFGQITKFAIQEDWLYLPAENKLIARVIGIAPLREVTTKGVVRYEPLLWIYYPEIRDYLAQQKINGNKKAENLDQLIDTHQFVSTVDKASDIPRIRAFAK